MTTIEKPTNASQQTAEAFRPNEHVFPSHLLHSRERDESQHLVQFYETDDFLKEMLCDFIETGLSTQDTCLLFATSAHLERLEEHLQARKLDLASLRRRGEY